MTGWHDHPDALITVVHKGTLTRTLEDCSVQRFSWSVPNRGRQPQAAHAGRNLGTEPVKLYATYMSRAGVPLSMDAPGPGCA